MQGKLTPRLAVLAALGIALVLGSACNPVKSTVNGVKAPGNAVKYYFPTGNPHLLIRLIDCKWVPPDPGRTCNMEGLGTDEVPGDAVYAHIAISKDFNGCEPVVKLTPRATTPNGTPTEQDSYYTLVRVESLTYLMGREDASAHWGNAPGPSSVTVESPNGHLGDFKDKHNPTRDDVITTLKLMVKAYPSSGLAKICRKK